MTRLFLTFKGLIFLCAFSLCIGSIASNAQVIITPTQSFSFGTFAMRDLAIGSRITIEPDGSYTSDSDTAILVPPSRGEFNVDAGIANANSVYTVTTPTSVSLTGPGGNIIIDDFVVSPTPLITNGVGVDDFVLSARLRTQGGGVSYGNGAYSGTLDITIAF